MRGHTIAMTQYYEGRVDIPPLEKLFDQLAAKLPSNITEADVDAIFAMLCSLAKALLANLAPGALPSQGEIRKDRSLLDPNFSAWPRGISDYVAFFAGSSIRCDVSCDYIYHNPRDGEVYGI